MSKSIPVPPVLGGTVYLTSRQVRVRYGGRSRQWLALAVKAGRFPAPVKLTGLAANYWRREDLEAFERKAA